jgi:hypothetical protein
VRDSHTGAPPIVTGSGKKVKYRNSSTSPPVTIERTSSRLCGPWICMLGSSGAM